MYRWLKRGRVIIASFIAVLITLSFLFIVAKWNHVFTPLLKVQFIPAMLGLLSGSFLIFLLLILLVVFFGRVYCSTLCPLGTFQDLVRAISTRFLSKRQRRFHYRKPWRVGRFFFLALAFLPLLFGSSYLLSLLDPYSSWGRISMELLNRGSTYVNNLFSNFYPESIFHINYVSFTLLSFIITTVFLIFLIIISAFNGRLYCNTICPVGTMLGLLSKYSAIKPVISKESCNKCMLCVINCKSGCIDIHSGTIDYSRCVMCFNCLSVCNRDAISLKNTWMSNSGQIATYHSKGRRDAILTLGAMGAFLTSRAILKGESKRMSGGVLPPGAKSIAHLKSNCTACHACLAACPSKIIQPATGEYGVDGLLMPVLKFDNLFCSYECNICSQICPSGALIPISLEDKKLTQIGQVNFYEERCIVVTDGTACGACDEHCPTKAITMIPYDNKGLTIPKVDREICIGCGGCEYVCPATEKAMVVEPLSVHGVANEPLVEKQEKIVVDEFGF